MRKVVAFAALAIMSVAALPGSGQELSAPEKNFEFVWRFFNANYATFPAKHIDWQALYAVYRPRVTARTTDDELFAILSQLLGPLNDNHVQFRSLDPLRVYMSGYLWDHFGSLGLDRVMGVLQSRPAPARYFPKPPVESDNKVFVHAWLADGIGYLHLNSFQDEDGSIKALDGILEDFREARAIVVDVRRNSGGDDHLGRLLASRFADRKRLYMTTQDRNGPRHDDYDPPRHFFVEPLGPRQFTGTVILLANRLSLSAAENFTLAMRILPHVTVLGDFTSGCFADMETVTMPNGWQFSYAKNLFLDWRGFCWEGIGVPPDLKFKADEMAPPSDGDPVLDMAMALIRSGKLGLQDPAEGTEGTVSLASLLEKDLEQGGPAKAVEALERRKEEVGRTDYYLDFFELAGLGTKLFRSGRNAEGEAIFVLLDRLYPGVAQANEQLAMEYLRLNRKADARAELEKALARRQAKLNPCARQFAEYLVDRLLLTSVGGSGVDLRAECDALQKQYPEQFNESVLNRAGYKLLGASRLTEAIAAFQLNTERYPLSANTWDSLGEAFMTAGQKKKASACYEKSLQLDPKNQNAADKLKELRGK